MLDLAELLTKLCVGHVLRIPRHHTVAELSQGEQVPRCLIYSVLDSIHVGRCSVGVIAKHAERLTLSVALIEKLEGLRVALRDRLLHAAGVDVSLGVDIIAVFVVVEKVGIGGAELFDSALACHPAMVRLAVANMVLKRSLAGGVGVP